ncbi:MAG TPA: VOC family protein [Thermomicrobiales bacterium]|nr:VOC family protein [Thermomicrobiales bacterium]
MSSKSHDTLRETGGIQIAGLAEVVLNVHNLDRSLAFYRDLLGLTVISPPERTNPIFLRAGDAGADLPALVVLVQLPPDTPDFSRPRTLHHLALAVPADAFDAAHNALTTAGFNVRFGQHPVIPSRTMYIDDPDGNEVELIAPR